MNRLSFICCFDLFLQIVECNFSRKISLTTFLTFTPCLWACSVRTALNPRQFQFQIVGVASTVSNSFA